MEVIVLMSVTLGLVVGGFTVYSYRGSSRNDGRHRDETMEPGNADDENEPNDVGVFWAYQLTPQAASNLCATYLLCH